MQFQFINCVFTSFYVKNIGINRLSLINTSIFGIYTVKKKFEMLNVVKKKKKFFFFENTIFFGGRNLIWRRSAAEKYSVMP